MTNDSFENMARQTFKWWVRQVEQPDLAANFWDCLVHYRWPSVWWCARKLSREEHAPTQVRLLG